MRVTVIGSGSRGNGVLVESSGARVLVDAGFPPRTVRRRLTAARGAAPRAIDAIVVTHAHADHARHVAALQRSFGARVVTHDDFRDEFFLRDAAEVERVARDGRVEIGDVAVSFWPVPHDAPQVALRISSGGEAVGLATDLGAVPDGLVAHLAGCRALLLECNHDPELLAGGPYPPHLKRRIAGADGHLSNDQSAELLRSLPVPPAVVVLMHLSETNNRPALAIDAARRALAGSGARVVAASQGSALAVVPAPAVQPALTFA